MRSEAKMMNNSLDCVIIGYNEIPFVSYEKFLRNYGEDTAAYRDLKFSFVNVEGQKLDYVGLLNFALEASRKEGNSRPGHQPLKSGDIPNLAAVTLMNFLRRRGMQAQYINLFQHEKNRLIEYLATDPVCVAITTTFYVVNLPVIEMVEFIRRYNPKVKIVVGGPLIANHARNYLKPEVSIADNDVTPELSFALRDIGADIYVIEGQGEHTLFQVINCLKENEDLKRVPNIIYHQDNRLWRTYKAAENNSLDENYIDWRAISENGLGYTVQTRTARSCAFNCSFCNYPTRAGKLALMGVETVERELNTIRDLGKTKNVVFIDDTFNIPLPRFKDLCRMMIKNNYGFNWFSYFRCSNSDEEAFELMARSGCKGVFLGIESGAPLILKNMNKAATIDKYVNGLKMLHEYDILTFGSFIVGFPGETTETVEETISFIKETKPEYYRAQMWYCEPGTPIDRHRQQYGIEGEGFVWSHATMDSLEAMDHIDRLFLTIKESAWLPQWSFDFWIIPYLLGLGISLTELKKFMTVANRLLAMEIATVAESEKSVTQRECIQNLVDLADSWTLAL
jgi:radical SAM PhpK family P-methyltransferase